MLEARRGRVTVAGRAALSWRYNLSKGRKRKTLDSQLESVRQHQFLKFIRKGEHAFNIIYIAKEKQVQPTCKVKTNLVKKCLNEKL